MNLTDEQREADVREGVTYVASLLDQDVPNWRRKLIDAYGSDLAKLKVSEAYACVTAAVYHRPDFDDDSDQLRFNGYNRGVNALEKLSDGIYESLELITYATACFHGENERLRRVWLEQVTQ